MLAAPIVATRAAEFNPPPPVRVEQDHVLAIDDDAFVRAVLVQSLHRMGMKAVPVADGAAARAALRERRFRAVICDLKLPGADGIELLRDVANHQPEAGLVLMSSADPRTLEAAAQVAEARQLRLLGTLGKPIAAEQLSLLLKRLDRPVPAAERAGSTTEVSADRLRTAITAGEVDVYVQPKVALDGGRLVGVEALARWIRPDGRVVQPEALIGVADRSGQMDALTDLVVRQAFAGWASWHRQGVLVDVSINLPIDSLDRLDLPDRLGRTAERFGVPPERVVLEVTETGVMKDLAAALDVVTRLRLRGYQLSVDDFGTGYSSLQQLRRFPFTELKLDRGFVNGASRDPALRSIAASSLHLAHDLKLTTCAEGVETRADYELMRELGYDLAQGYLISEPMPKSRFRDWARQWGGLGR